MIRIHLKLHREMPWHFRLVERDSGCLNLEQQQRVQHLREQYERQLLLMLGAPRRLLPGNSRGRPRHCQPAQQRAQLAGAPTLEQHEHDELLENLLAGAIERVLASKIAAEPTLRVTAA